MPLDPDKLREAGEKAAGLSKRMDAFMERRKADPEDEDDDDEDEEEEEELFDPAEEAMRATPGTDLANPEPDEPWFE
jgi:hypothetical protein